MADDLDTQAAPKEEAPNAERVRALVSYDPETGIIRWLKTGKGRRRNLIAGAVSRPLGYIQIQLDGRLYYAHRIAYVLMTGKWPRQQIDHVNGNPSDNRWINLRAASSSQNHCNSPVGPRNTSGYKGVSLVRKNKKWRAVINIGGVATSLGCFDTKEEAARAYANAAPAYHGEFAFTGRLRSTPN